ncbi:enoyl-CoA hydratase/isomerase family protein [Mycetocola zhujimingii]|uniref:Enoyl-CoA hydratase n=1 Tax=Mycetocola zhujimingii TaxID=2079792 RepID=A0A2U1TDC7_9MICO|nr:enoyl-CoA hydratase/isomerase family protein [Mycetocola zhujimingii]PWC06901.1 enoyl-CoA hydratase [Mycetocola zhujimingii]
MTDSILLTVDDGLAHVTLNRPARLNAINEDAARAWRDIAQQVADRDDIGAVLLDAAGPAFCAGGDVAEMSSLGGDTGSTIGDLADIIHEGHRIFTTTPKPMVAAVNGAVAGGGLGFMLVADYIVASESSKFVSKYADIGLTPDCGVSTLLPEAIGVRRALQLALSSKLLTAAEALDWGLVAEVVADGESDARAREVANVWLSGATAAFGQAKRLLRDGAFRDFQSNLDDESRTINAAAATDDARARIAAFAARSARR